MEAQQRYQGVIISDPSVMLGKPVIAGTRLTVDFILDLLSNGQTVADIQTDFPNLTQEQIMAALAFAADALRSDRVYPLIEAS